MGGHAGNCPNNIPRITINEQVEQLGRQDNLHARRVVEVVLGPKTVLAYNCQCILNWPAQAELNMMQSIAGDPRAQKAQLQGNTPIFEHCTYAIPFLGSRLQVPFLGNPCSNILQPAITMWTAFTKHLSNNDGGYGERHAIPPAQLLHTIYYCPMRKVEPTS